MKALVASLQANQNGAVANTGGGSNAESERMIAELQAKLAEKQSDLANSLGTFFFLFFFLFSFSFSFFLSFVKSVQHSHFHFIFSLRLSHCSVFFICYLTIFLLRFVLLDGGNDGALDARSEQQRMEYAARGISLVAYETDNVDPYFINLDEDAFRSARFM